jgi:hypothetical protein
MLPCGSLKNSRRSEFSQFALSNEENVFVPTYANNVLNRLRTRLSTDGGGGVHLSDTD